MKERKRKKRKEREREGPVTARYNGPSLLAIYLVFQYGICDSRKQVRQSNRLLPIKDTSPYKRRFRPLVFYFFSFLLDRHYFVQLSFHRRPDALSEIRFYRITSGM